MKISKSGGSKSRRHQRRGFAVIALLALLALVVGFMVANTRAISGLGNELKAIERKQIHRLNHSPTTISASTVATTNVNVPEKPASQP